MRVRDHSGKLLHLTTLILLMGLASLTYAQTQQVRVAVESAAPGQYEAHIYYQPSDGRKATGLGIRVHYQQSVIRVTGTSDLLADSTGLQIQDDQADHDGEVRTDRNSGILTVAGVGRFKPDFLVRPLSALESEYFLAHRNADGLALRADHVNADGRPDILLYTQKGVQAFFALGE